MDEFSLIEAIKQKSYKQASLQKGIGDDAAVFRELTNDLVVAVDTFVEGVHFTADTIDPHKLGYRCLAANLSDLAAMGSVPIYYLVSIVVPRSWDKSDILQIFNGMKHLANKYHVDLIGGDTVSGNELVLSVTVIGRVGNGRARYRSAARPDDIVFVTGTLGDSQAGLYLLQQGIVVADSDYFIRRHQMPSPRINFANNLKAIKRIALNDISDGLGSEINEIAEESQVTIILDDDKIPVHPSYPNFPAELQEKWKYFGGEDFELAGTVSKEDWPHVKEIAERLELSITHIGHVINKEENAVYLKRGSAFTPLKKAGYTHLK